MYGKLGRIVDCVCIVTDDSNPDPAWLGWKEVMNENFGLCLFKFVKCFETWWSVAGFTCESDYK